ncbi:MAG: tetratricopeptide repeat protein [Persicimonas sp.]
MSEIDQVESPPAEAIEDFQTVKREVGDLLESAEIDPAIQRLEDAASLPDSTRYLDENIWLYRQLGDLYRAFDREDDALGAYRQAYGFDPRNRQVAEPLAELLLAREAGEEAAGVLRSLLLHHKQAIPAERLGWAHRQLGALYESNGSLEKARHAFEKALQDTAQDQLALTGLLRVVGTIGEPADVIEVRRKLIKSLDDSRARSMALVAMGDDWKEKFNDPWRALDTYEEALAEDEKNTRALESITTVARQIGDWRRLARAYFTLHRLAETPEEKANWLIESSQIARQELWEPEKALAGFRRALELDPTRLDAFKAATSLLVDAKDWEQLEAAYLQLIAANQDLDEPDERLLAVLWQKLGDLYNNHLERRDEAITAYHHASKLMPQNIELHEQVAELAEGDSDYGDLAMDHLRAIVRHDPTRIDVLERIGKVHLRKKEVDPAFCYLRAFDFRGGTLGEKASGFINRLKSPMVDVPARPLTTDLLRRFVFSDQMDRDVTRVFSVIKPALTQWVGESRRKYGLGRRDRVKFKEKLAFNNIYKQIGASLGYDDLPDLWRKPDQPGLINGALVPEGMIVGDELLGSGREKHIAFIVGKQLFLFLAPFYLPAIRPTSDLQVFFLLATALVKPEFDFDKDDHTKRAFKDLKKHVRGDDLNRLEHAINKVTAREGDIDLNRWVEAVEDTANRVGFIFCDDLDVARDYLRNEPQTMGMRSVEKRMQDLADYAVSERYMTLRQELNISVG